eukprot:9468448-Pyramimonas_sp.AAC.1
MGFPLSKRPENHMREWHGGVDAKLGHPIWGCKTTVPQITLHEVAQSAGENVAQVIAPGHRP